MFNEKKDQESESSEISFENVEPTEMINANSTEKLTNVAKTQPDDVADEVFGALTAVNLKKSANELTSETQAYGEGKSAGKLMVLNTKQIEWAVSRHLVDQSFQDDDFEELCDNIEDVGINVRAISVRQICSDPRSEPRYELLEGHRRLQACIATKCPVSAIVYDQPFSSSHGLDQILGDRFSKDLSPYEFGLQLLNVMSTNWTKSDAAFAKQINLKKSRLSRALALAKLPNEITSVIKDLRELKVRDGLALVKALKRNENAVLDESRSIAETDKSLAAHEMVARLLAAVGEKTGVAQCNTRQPLIAKGQVVGHWQLKPSGKIEIDPIAQLPWSELKLAMKKFEQIFEKYVDPGVRLPDLYNSDPDKTNS